MDICDLQTFVDCLGDAVVVIESNLRVVLANVATRQMFGRTAGEVLEEPCYAAFHGRSTPTHGVAVDSGGNVYVTGQTANGDFLTTAGALQNERLELIDGFVSVLDGAGQNLLYSSFLGGSGEYCGECYSSGNALAVDGTGLILAVD